jgi:fatty acid desaturase
VNPPADLSIYDQSREDALTDDERRELMRIKPWKVGVDLAICWLLLLASIEVAILSNSWWVVAICFVFIGCLQNGLISWTHEASHCNIHRNRKINDWISDLLICGPAGIAVDQYRWHHVSHHKYLGDAEKEVELPAWLCLRGGNLFAEIARHIFGFFALHIVLRKRRYSRPDSPHRPPPPRSKLGWIGFLVGNALLFGLCALQGKWYLYFVLWVGPLFTIALLVTNFRTVVEHQASSDVCDLGHVKMPAMTRVIEANFLERMLIAPVGFHYHYEHHLYPSIPYHRLAEARAILRKKGHFDREGIVRERGYLRTLWRLAMEPGYGIRLLNPLYDGGETR